MSNLKCCCNVAYHQTYMYINTTNIASTKSKCKCGMSTVVQRKKKERNDKDFALCVHTLKWKYIGFFHLHMYVSKDFYTYIIIINQIILEFFKAIHLKQIKTIIFKK